MLRLSRATRKKAEGTTDEGARGERSLLQLSRETRKKAEGSTDEGARGERSLLQLSRETRKKAEGQLTKTSERRAELAPAIPRDEEERGERSLLRLSRETRKKAEGTTDEGARGEQSLLQLSRETRKKAEGSTDEGNSIRNNTLIYYIRPSWRSMTTRQERYPVPGHAAPRCFCQHHATRHKTLSTAYHITLHSISHTQT